MRKKIKAATQAFFSILKWKKDYNALNAIELNIQSKKIAF